MIIIHNTIIKAKRMEIGLIRNISGTKIGFRILSFHLCTSKADSPGGGGSGNRGITSNLWVISCLIIIDDTAQNKVHSPTRANIILKCIIIITNNDMITKLIIKKGFWRRKNLFLGERPCHPCEVPLPASQPRTRYAANTRDSILRRMGGVLSSTANTAHGRVEIIIRVLNRGHGILSPNRLFPTISLRSIVWIL